MKELKKNAPVLDTLERVKKITQQAVFSMSIISYRARG